MTDPTALKEEEWVAQQRDIVVRYLERQGVSHGAVGEWPAWDLFPYVAIWAVESLIAPGRVGWWVISGDLPTDYVSFRDAHDPRGVLAHFACHWQDVADHMLRGEVHPETHIGTPEQWSELGDLLKRRSSLLHEFAQDDGLWVDEER